MAKYIDAEMLIKVGKKAAENTNDYAAKIAMETMEKLINLMPAADVVEVVKCKDCKFADPYMTYDGVEMHLCDNLGVSGLEPCDFCSYGERKSQ